MKTAGGWAKMLAFEYEGRQITRGMLAGLMVYDSLQHLLDKGLVERLDGCTSSGITKQGRRIVKAADEAGVQITQSEFEEAMAVVLEEFA